jgi:hypothetical protein
MTSMSFEGRWSAYRDAAGWPESDPETSVRSLAFYEGVEAGLGRMVDVLGADSGDSADAEVAAAFVAALCEARVALDGAALAVLAAPARGSREPR